MRSRSVGVTRGVSTFRHMAPAQTGDGLRPPVHAGLSSVRTLELAFAMVLS